MAPSRSESQIARSFRKRLAANWSGGAVELLGLQTQCFFRGLMGIDDGPSVPEVELGPLNLGPARPRLHGRDWVTRPRPHVDRIASAWLVKRFIDPDARFLFADADKFPSDAIGFDSPGATFTHDGDDCTFETLMKRFGLRDARLSSLAEIVHEADLRDAKFPRDEARGLDLALRGVLSALPEDNKVLAYGLTLFDGLYAASAEAR